MKTGMLAATSALLLFAATGGAFAQANSSSSSTPAPTGNSMLCSDFTALSADAQDAFLKGFNLGVNQGISPEQTGAIGSSTSSTDVTNPANGANAATSTDNSTNMAANSSSSSTDVNASSSAMGAAGIQVPDAATLASNCQTNPSDPLSKYLGMNASSSQ